MQIFLVVTKTRNTLISLKQFNVIMNQNSIEILRTFEFIIIFGTIIITETIDTPTFSLLGINVYLN